MNINKKTTSNHHMMKYVGGATRTNCTNIHHLIINKILMIGCNILAYIHLKTSNTKSKYFSIWSFEHHVHGRFYATPTN
jgi:hypothetical protein